MGDSPDFGFVGMVEVVCKKTVTCISLGNHCRIVNCLLTADKVGYPLIFRQL